MTNNCKIFLCYRQCSGSEINNFGSGSGSSNWKSGISDPDPGSGSGSFCNLRWWKKSCQFWLFWRHKWVEILNFFNFSSIVYEIMMNLLTFKYIFNRYFYVWCVKGEDPDPEQDPDSDPWGQIISDPGGSGTLVTDLIQVDLFWNGFPRSRYVWLMVYTGAWKS